MSLHGIAVTVAFLAVFCLPTVLGTDLTSAFESTAVCGGCPYADPATAACSCPSPVMEVGQGFTVRNDCETSLPGGSMATCINKVAGLDSYGGGYQHDDDVPTSHGCRHPNPAANGTCACPPGFDDVAYRALADLSTGSYIHLCFNKSARAAGGAYQAYDFAPSCRTPNPYTGDCSCPSGYIAASLRVIVDGPQGSTLVVCSEPAPAPPTPPPPPPTEICPGQFAVLDGYADVTAAVQACVDATPPGGALALPAGLYGILTQVRVSTSLILKTDGLELNDTRTCGQELSLSPPECATFIALPGCCHQGGVLTVVDGAAGAHVNHIVIDGNRDRRVTSEQATWCHDSVNNRMNGINARVNGVDNITFAYSASVNALCASSLIWDSEFCHVHKSYFARNGDHFSQNMWSDGVTMLSCRFGHVTDNTFEDNSDVNFIMGCGKGTRVEGLTVTMTNGSSAACFAGVMLDNFNGNTCGNYQGLEMVDTVIDCGIQRCDFGAEFGPKPWYESRNIVGGAVVNMTVDGAKQGVNVGGAGISGAPLVIDNLVVGPVPSEARFLCGLRPTSKFNIEPGSNVSMSNAPPHSDRLWEECP